jgi:hypothetical protein
MRLLLASLVLVLAVGAACKQRPRSTSSTPTTVVWLEEPAAHGVARGPASSPTVSVTFTWRPVAGAVAYRLTLYPAAALGPAGALRQPGHALAASEPRLRRDLPHGAWAWEVEAVGPGDVPVASSELRSLVTCPHPARPGAPDLDLIIDASDVEPGARVRVAGRVSGAACAYVTYRLNDGPLVFASMEPAGRWSIHAAIPRAGWNRMLVTGTDGRGIEQVDVPFLAYESPAAALE